MPDLLKIRDVSVKYDISTRALKYYEDMGLIKSTHVDDYSYRCYDEKNIMRLEQILILRKLDISVKDIVRIFEATGANILLELLHRKVESINEQTFLLDDLKKIILEFIDQIEIYDFNSQSDIRLLYEKTMALENQYQNSGSTSIEKLMETTKKLEKEPVVSVIDFPAVKMVICYDSPDGETFHAFKEWVKQVEQESKPMFTNYFEWFNVFNDKIAGLYPLPPGYETICPYDVFDFPGGLYASATFLDDPYPYSIEIDSGFIYKWVGASDEYELYLTDNDAAARFIMWRPLSTVGKEHPQIEIFIPIVKKGANNPVKTLDIDGNRFGDCLNIKQINKIDLRSMHKSGDLSVRFNKDELILYQLGQEGKYITAESFELPLRIDLIAKTDSGNIRMYYNSAGLVFNWGMSPSTLLTHDVLVPEHTPIYGVGYIPPNEYAEITWILEREYAAVIVNGQTRLYKTDFYYIEQLKKEPALQLCFPINLNTAFGAEVTVKELTVYELK